MQEELPELSILYVLWLLDKVWGDIVVVVVVVVVPALPRRVHIDFFQNRFKNHIGYMDPYAQLKTKTVKFLLHYGDVISRTKQEDAPAAVLKVTDSAGDVLGTRELGIKAVAAYMDPAPQIATLPGVYLNLY
eukprot:jgi/Psemu1/53779/gm1.53779_g